jgi:L-rhamnose isomerase
MPLDQHNHGGGGGGDRRHDLIPEIARTTIEAVGISAKKAGICMECLALQLAGASMANFLMQQNAVNMKTRDLDADLIQRLTQAIINVAMDEVGKVLDAHQRREG